MRARWSFHYYVDIQKGLSIKLEKKNVVFGHVVCFSLGIGVPNLQWSVQAIITSSFFLAQSISLLSHLSYVQILFSLTGQLVQWNMFNAAGCAASTAAGQTIFYAVGVCGSINGTAPYSRYTVVASGSKSFLVKTDFTSSVCTGTGKVQGNATIGGTCNNVGGNFMTVTTATTVTQPANSQGQLVWTTKTACNTGLPSISGLYAAMYVTATSTAAQQCANNNNNGFGCPGAFTSTTGGFFLQNYYAAAGCTGTPLQSMAMQMGVCQVQSTSTQAASALFFPVTKPNGMTQFNVTYFMGSATCSTGTGVVKQSSSAGLNTTSCKKVAGVSAPANVPTGAAFYSISFATTIGFTSGYSVVQYTTAAGCAASTLTTASSLSFISSASVCSQTGAMTTSPVVAACPAVVTTPSTIYASTRFALVHPHPIYTCDHINFMSFHFLLLLF